MIGTVIFIDSVHEVLQSELEKAGFNVATAANGLDAYPYHKALDATIARSYLHSWLTLNAARFTKATGRKPTLVDLYAIHNLGFNGYRQRGFDIGRCPGITKRKAALLR